MLDYRMHTFLTLCRTMHYRLTAEALNMTQPAVTQHIQFLERYYGCKLFQYHNRQLSKTSAGVALEVQGRGMAYQAKQLQAKLSQVLPPPIRIGATKTIGDYVVAPMVAQLLQEGCQLSLVVDNTQNLLQALDRMDLDVALIEGYFDKSAYDYQLMREEQLVGICSQHHPFAGKTIAIEALFDQRLLLREAGSGTRAVLEQLLLSQNFTLEAFPQQATISSIEVIKSLVKADCGISFVYQSVAQSDRDLGLFSLTGGGITHQFHYVYLKGTQGLGERTQHSERFGC